ncbi:MAG: HlyD family efflux transporter periplasmic adaptor subunit [Planctomycetales bacterium]|nr:HlyD family efflux transporter periplasmic adaptor subunit [Planctomycetales bacterium]
MRIPQSLRILFAIALVGGIAIVAYQTRNRWPRVLTGTTSTESHADEAPIAEEPKVLKLSEQARRNLGLVSRAARAQTYWRTIQIPGSIVDRPGQSDRGVTSPAVGVIKGIHAFPGETVHPGDRLFTLHLFSEYLQNTQKEFFAATNEIQLLKAEHARLSPLAQSGGVPQARLIELNNQISRQQALIQAHRQDLLTRGLAPEQIEQIASGKFVSTVDVVAPPLARIDPPTETSSTDAESQGKPAGEPQAYEMHDLEVELGQQVQAGQLLAMLANHSELYVEGHAFKREAPWLERAAQQGWPVTIEFAEDDPLGWPTIDQRFEIRFLANTVDAENRTFDFFIPLTNQSRTYRKRGETFLVWRFRPGQRVRLHVPVEEMQNVLVLPSDGVVREGPEAFVFQQNGDLFNRLAVHVLHEDRTSIVIANDGSVTPGLFLAQNSAASLNRVLKAQAASGVRADVHVHADGTVHAAH